MLLNLTESAKFQSQRTTPYRFHSWLRDGCETWWNVLCKTLSIKDRLWGIRSRQHQSYFGFRQFQPDFSSEPTQFSALMSAFRLASNSCPSSVVPFRQCKLCSLSFLSPQKAFFRDPNPLGREFAWKDESSMVLEHNLFGKWAFVEMTIESAAY